LRRSGRLDLTTYEGVVMKGTKFGAMADAMSAG